MIRGYKENKIDRVMASMNAFPAEFILTGSRAYSELPIRDQSTDWDFFTIASKSTEDFLVQLGFVKTNDFVYGDPAIMQLYRFSWIRDQIDVQVIAAGTDYLAKRIVHEHFLANPHELSDNKLMNKRIWSSRIALAVRAITMTTESAIIIP